MKYLCIGQSAWDITLPTDIYPEENTKLKIGNNKVECGGGSSNNQAYLLGYWNEESYLASPIGNDMYGKRIKEELKSVNVNIDYLKEIDCETTVSYIIANIKNGTRTIITNKSELMHYDKDDEILLKPDCILLDGNSYELAIKTIKQNNKALVILDAGGLKEGTLKLLEYSDYIVCSHDFARDYSKMDINYEDKDNLIKIYDKIQSDFNGKLIITLEDKGSFVKIKDKYKIIKSIKQKTVDSTGAGDIFHGAFAYFITHNYQLEDAIRMSNIAGALSVRYIGSKKSMPSKEEVLKYE